MRRSLSLLVAVAMAASTASLAPVQARTMQAPAAITSDSGSVTNVGDRGDRRWKQRRHSDRHWNHRRHRDRSYFRSQFYFPFPYFAPQRYSYAPRYRCHGRLVYHHGRYHCYAY